MNEQLKPVGVIGVGWVGLVTAACFAELGHKVVARDILPEKVQALSRGEVAIHEPGLEDLIHRNAERITAATSSGVSTRSVATSMAPTRTSLPSRSAISSMGTRECAHSRDTWSMEEAARRGNVCSYWRHSVPRVFFHSMFALMPYP